MVTLPRNTSELMLAPVILEIVARLDDLGRLAPDELAFDVALVSGTPDWSRQFREDGLLRLVTRFVDLHGWDVGWDPAGLRVTHGRRSVVLSVPPTFADYLANGDSDQPPPAN